jgi:CheY-like chemotaxis protein
MDDTVRAKLFDPFFTTKLLGRGLGMSAVLGIVHGHHGAIMVSSKPRKGTVISVLFPVASAASASPGAQKSVATITPKAPATPLSGTVLVADDESQVRAIMELLLKRMGLQVLPAVDGEQAVELFRQHAAEIKFVLMDLSMPKLDGRKALAEIRKIRPDIKVVLTSGYDSDDLIRRYEQEGFDAFIQKPCDVDTFKTVVRQMCT